MKLKLISALAASLLSAAPVFAETVTLDFEGAGEYYALKNFYNGGANEHGASGTNYGIAFGDAVFAADTTQVDTSNVPSGNTIMFASDNIDGQGSMNVASGFSGIVSFYYSSSVDATVNVWSGIAGTGSVLATFALSANSQNGCSDTTYCHWDFASIDLGSNLAKSIQFGEGAAGVGFDNVTVNAVPVPAAAWLMGSALLGLGGVARRRVQS